MKRTKTFAASIIGLIIGAIGSLMMLVTLSVVRTPEMTDMIIQIMKEQELSEIYTLETFLTILYGVLVFMLVFCVVYLVLSIVALILSKSSVEKFHKFRWVLILKVVLGFIAGLATLSSVFVLAAVFIIISVLYILDLKNESSQYRVYTNNEMYGSNNNYYGQNNEQINVNDYDAQVVKQPAKEESVDEKLTRLLNLKEKGLISDEDYARMRATILNNDFDNKE